MSSTGKYVNKDSSKNIAQRNKQQANENYEKEKAAEPYLEENYDNGNLIKRYKQWADDKQKALGIAERKQDREEELKEIYGELTAELVKDETMYLVDGARLSCNKATRSLQKLMIDEKEYKFECPQHDSMNETKLMIEKNGRSINGQSMATVEDTAASFRTESLNGRG